MAAGDAVFRLDGRLLTEFAGLADHWDEVLCRNLANILTETCTSAALAIARRDARFLPGDHVVWADLAAALRGSEVALEPLTALPARP